MALLVDPEFFDLFRTVEHTAFRLEVRDSYYEKEQEAQFLSGGPVDISYMEGWLALIVKARVAGKRVQRVRVVTEPHSDYTRYGLWLCQYNTQAGEEIRYLSRTDAGGLPNHDYWLIDSRQLYIVRFGDGDELLGAELVEDPEEVVRHAAWRDLAWHRAVPYDEYVKATNVSVDCPASA